MLGPVAFSEEVGNLDPGSTTTRGRVGLMLHEDGPRITLAHEVPTVAVRAAIKLSRTKGHNPPPLLLSAKDIGSGTPPHAMVNGLFEVSGEALYDLLPVAAVAPPT
jgi:hypothetical protein